MGSDRPGDSRAAVWRGRRPFSSPLQFSDAHRDASELLRAVLQPLCVARVRYRSRVRQSVEGVTEGDGVEIILVVILDDRRVHVEYDRHLTRFTRLHRLFCETKAIDLVEIGSSRAGRDVIRGLRADRTCGTAGRSEEHTS